MALFHSRARAAPDVVKEREAYVVRTRTKRTERVFELIQRSADELRADGWIQRRCGWYTLTMLWPGIAYMRVHSFPTSGSKFVEAAEAGMSLGQTMCRYGLIVDLQGCCDGTPEHATAIASYLHNRRILTKATFEGCIFLLDARNQILARILLPLIDALFKQLHKPDTRIEIVVGKTSTTSPTAEEAVEANRKAKRFAASLAAQFPLAGLQTPILEQGTGPCVLRTHEDVFVFYAMISMLFFVGSLTVSLPKWHHQLLERIGAGEVDGEVADIDGYESSALPEEES